MHLSSSPRPLAARRAGPLSGQATVPGDKSISHRALILGALSVGETRIAGLLEAEDVLNTAQAVRLLGAHAEREAPGAWRVRGVGVGGFCEPDTVLDFGNSGTGSRLVMGAVATTPVTVVFTGDESLRRRPMRRVLAPLALFGAEYWSRSGGLMPLTLRGASVSPAIDHDVTVASAQVKSALLLAALNAPGRSRIVQHALTRDHTERMLQCVRGKDRGRAARARRRSDYHSGRGRIASHRDRRAARSLFGTSLIIDLLHIGIVW